MKRREARVRAAAAVVDVLVAAAVAVVVVAVAGAGKRSPEAAAHNASAPGSILHKTEPSYSPPDRPSKPSSPPSSTYASHSSPPQDWVSGDTTNAPIAPPSAKNLIVSLVGPGPWKSRRRRSDGRRVGRLRFSGIG